MAACSLNRIGGWTWWEYGFTRVFCIQSANKYGVYPPLTSIRVEILFQKQTTAECRELPRSWFTSSCIFLNLFLLTTNRTSTCYTYLSTSLSIALRMGLHRSLKTNQDLISQEISKRIFWALWQLVNDVASCCGLPRLLNDDEIDQELPREVNDVFIAKGEISMQPKDEICYISGANASYRLHIIRDKVTRHIYPSQKREHRPVGWFDGLRCQYWNYTRNRRRTHRMGEEHTPRV